MNKLCKADDKFAAADESTEDIQSLAAEICTKLTAHATAEAELLYPAAHEVLVKDEDLVDEADVEHASAKDLIAQIESGSPGNPLYDAKVKVLGKEFDHHFTEEEGEIFPKVRKTDLDSDVLERNASRKAELLGALIDA